MMIDVVRFAMKTMKIFLSIAGFALTGICFGQLFSQDNSEILFYTAYYNAESNILEHQVTRSPAETKAGDYFEAPVLTRTYFVPIEFDMAVEIFISRAVLGTKSRSHCGSGLSRLIVGGAT